jgi:8-oxo-dGTP diphosphatase
MDFVFPAKPSWNQKVYVFLARTWLGTPVERDEMRPAWFAVSQLPLERMWQDAAHWLPQVLSGQSLFKRFVFSQDNETVEAISDVEMTIDP